MILLNDMNSIINRVCIQSIMLNNKYGVIHNITVGITVGITVVY